MKKTTSLFLILVNLILSVNTVFGVNDIWDPFNGDKDVNIVFLGGSITQGEGYRKYMSEYMKRTYEPLVPERKITCVNSGIGGTGSNYGSIRLKRDVIDYDPDMVFVEFSVNDIRRSENEVLINMETIVRNLQSLNNPPMIVFVYTTGTNMKNVSDIHHKIAQYYKIPEIDFKQYMIDEGFEAPETGTTYENLPSKMKMMYADLTHPNSKGGEYWADYAISLLEEKPQKYFKHPELKSVPYTNDYNDKYLFKYVSAIDALNSGKAKVAGNEGEDYEIDSFNNRVDLKTKQATYNYTFSGRVIKVEYLAGTATGKARFQVNSELKEIDTYGPYNLTTPAYSKENITSYSDSSISITPTGTKSEKSTGTDISIKGFFTEAEDVLPYPSKYSDDVVINKGEISEETVESDIIKYESELQLAVDLGIFDANVLTMADDEISRAKFAQIISNIILPNRDKNEEWYRETFYEDNNDIEVEKKAEVQNIFEDVEVNHENFDDIRIAYEYKLMNGVSSIKFSPEKTISAFQVGVVLTKMLGYRINAELAGVYPQGYMKMISELGILKGISDYNEPVTYRVLAKILSNVYDINVFGIESLSGGNAVWSERDNVFLSFYFDIDWIAGQMTQNSATTLTEASKRNDTVVVGGYSFFVGKDKEYVNEYIGRDVKVYYDRSDDDYKVIAVYPTEKDEIIEIKAEDFIKFDNNTISYYYNNREKTQRIAANSYVIYNGLAISTYDKTIFDFAKGDITFIKPKGLNSYNTVIINDYRDWIVVENNTNDKMLIRKGDGKVIENEDNEVIKYDAPEGNVVYTKDAEGNYINIENIKSGTVLNVAQNANVIKIICSDKVLEGFVVSSKEIDEDGNVVISNGEDTYTVVSEYDEKDGFSKIISGHSYTFCIDSFGYIVWSEQNSSAGIYHGMLISVKSVLTDDGEEGICAGIMGFESGTVTKYIMTGDVNITNNEGVSVKCKTSPAIENALYMQKDGIVTDKIWDGFITYTLNSDGNIKNIDMARTVKDNTANADVVYDIIATENFDDSVEYSAQLWHQKFKYNNNVIFYDKTKTKYMNCRGDDERKYIVSNTAEDLFVQDKKYNIKAYGHTYGISTAEYIVRNCDAPEPNMYSARKNVYIVRNIEQEINEDNELVDKLDVILLGTNGKAVDAVFYSKKDALGEETKSFVQACPDLCMSGKMYKIEKGDIITILQEDKNSQYIDNAYMIYKNNASVPGLSNAKLGWIVGAQRGYFANASNGIGNPYYVAERALGNNALYDPAYSTVVTKGYIESYKNGVIKYTTRDLSVPIDNSDTADYITKNIRKTYSTTATGGYAVTYHGSNLEVKSLEDNNIKAYENYRNEASAILTILCEGSEGVMIVINKD